MWWWVGPVAVFVLLVVLQTSAFISSNYRLIMLNPWGSEDGSTNIIFLFQEWFFVEEILALDEKENKYKIKWKGFR